jgi:hypothetical protein
MSKKRKRKLKKLAKVLGAGLAIAGLGRAFSQNRKANQMSGQETVSDAQKIASQLGSNTPEENTFKETVVSTPYTIQDSMPKVGMKKGNILPKNEYSKRITDKGEVYTIKGAKEGITKKIGNPESAFVTKDYIYQDGKPYTKGRYGTFRAKKEMERGMLPPQLRVPKINTYGGSMSGLTEGDFAAKKGGRATKSGFKRRGAAKRGFGRAFKGGKR